MKVAKGFGVIALLAATALVNIDTASASTFTYNGTSVTNAETIQIQTPRAVTGLAGQIALSGTGANAGQTLYAWCLDIFNDLMQNGTYQIKPLVAGDSSGGSNPALSATQLASIGSLMLYGNSNVGSAHVSAATQLAIWDVEYGQNFSYNTGAFNSSTTALANTLVSDVSPGGSLLVPGAQVSLLSGTGNQSLGIATTPLPAAWTLLVSGVASLGFFGRRKTRTAVAAV